MAVLERERSGGAQATYRFADRAALDHGTRPEVIQRLVADFDRDWPGVPRTREIMTLAQEFEP